MKITVEPRLKEKEESKKKYPWIGQNYWYTLMFLEEGKSIILGNAGMAAFPVGTLYNGANEENYKPFHGKITIEV